MWKFALAIAVAVLVSAVLFLRPSGANGGESSAERPRVEGGSVEGSGAVALAEVPAEVQAEVQAEAARDDAEPAGQRSAAAPSTADPAEFVDELADRFRLRKAVSIRLVEWTSGQPVGNVTIRAGNGARATESVVLDASGSGTIRLPRGKHRLVLDPSTLPDGLVGPSRPELSVPHEKHRERWDYSPVVEVTDGPFDDVVTLYVRRGASVRGRVISSERSRLDGVEVRLTAVAPKDPVVRAKARVNAQGEYSTIVQPTTYRIQPRYLAGHTGPVLPAPRVLRVEPGTAHVVDFVLESGAFGFACTLEDPALLPGEEAIRWDSVKARLYATDVAINTDPEARVRGHTSNDAVLTAATDADGRLVVDGLPPGKYLLRFAADGFTPAERGSRFGAWIEAVPFELKTPGVTELGSVRALRERVCDVTVRMQSTSLPARSIEAHMQYPEINGAARGAYVRRLTIPEDGVLRFFVHTSPDSDESTLMLRKLGATEWEREITLDTPPRGSVETSITFR